VHCYASLGFILIIFLAEPLLQLSRYLVCGGEGEDERETEREREIHRERPETRYILQRNAPVTDFSLIRPTS
jgi:hypothetical protein